MPYPSKPSHLKVIDGSRGADIEVGIQLPVVEEVPEAPPWLPNEHAVAEWNRLAPILHANRLLTEAGTSALAVLCAVHGELVDMWSRRVPVTGNLLAQYRALINDFGLTPVAQGKVKPIGEEKKGNRFAARGKRPATAA